jgi:hypothetical protein
MNTQTEQKLKEIWDNYLGSGKMVVDTKGVAFNNIDKSRVEAITDIRKIISLFLADQTNVYEFKTSLDSYNKQNNYWGFTAAKGQMFFNLLTRSSVDSISSLKDILKTVITEPVSLADALSKMNRLYEYTLTFQQGADDKRKVANPMSSAYFLSYFWQIHDHEKWPIMYSSIIVSFQKLGIWNDQPTPYDNYEVFFELNEQIKKLLKQYTKRDITNWDLEHAFWNFSGTTSVNSKQPKAKASKIADSISEEIQETKILDPGFELHDYVIPRVSKLVELGASVDKSGSSKGSEFERLVAEAFKYLDFDVEVLGQGTGREPDAILKFPGEHIAFIVDAKAYASGYTLGRDDRAIREYINYYCPRLKQAGFNKIGFIIVSNSFRTDLKELINEITWLTEIKRFLLLTTDALLYLLAYKIKDKLSLSQIIETLIAFDTTVTKEKIIEEFGDY